MRQIIERDGACDAALLDKIHFLLGDAKVLTQIRRRRPMEPFAEETLAFLGKVSESIRRDRSLRSMPDVTAFVFWCRSVHLTQMKESYGVAGMRLGRGVSLHFAPSNIPVLFAYTMAAGLLAGNTAVVRLPQAQTEQADALIQRIHDVIESVFPQFRERIVLCRYAHEERITEYLSSLCDVRVIWGADASVREIRRAPLPPRAVELPFASRGSAALFDAEAMLQTADMERIAQAFYNDTYVNDQNACSSPQIICWLGSEKETEAAQKRFWGQMAALLRQRNYEVPATVAVQKLDAALTMAAVFPDVDILTSDNRLVRVFVPQLDERLWNYTVPGGFFIESRLDTPAQMEAILSDYCQTVCVFGVDREMLAAEFRNLRVAGADRIVEVGAALDFSLTWDGFDLIESMSRHISYGA